MEFSLIPMTFKCRLSQLCPVKSPTKILRSRLQRQIAYLVRALLYLCISNLPCRHPCCCCQFDLFPYRPFMNGKANRINRKTYHWFRKICKISFKVSSINKLCEIYRIMLPQYISKKRPDSVQLLTYRTCFTFLVLLNIQIPQNALTVSVKHILAECNSDTRICHKYYSCNNLDIFSLLLAKYH